MNSTVISQQQSYATTTAAVQTIYSALKFILTRRQPLTKHQCERCGKLHDPARHPTVTIPVEAAPATAETTIAPPAAAAAAATATATAAAASQPSNPNPSTNTNITPNSSSPDWTAEQDSLLMQLKSCSTPWKSIAETLGSGKTVQQLKERWREIDPAKKTDGTTIDGQKVENNTAAPAPAPARATTDEKKNEREKGKQKDKEKEKHDGATSESAGKNPSSKKDLVAWAEKYDDRKWKVVASKYFDRTGRRISAEQARKMAGREI